jgi:Raf kinase inhibitor-like YbhB/YbcL family protein
MRKSLGLALAAAVLSLSANMAIAQPQKRMALTSTSFQDGAVIPNKYTQASSNPVSPELSWTNVPDGTKSFTLIVDDPDTALRKTTDEVLHWAAFNIPATKTSLPEGVPNEAKLPDGTIQPLNTGRKPGFMGPGAGCCVYHHYTFQLYALDTRLDLGPDATRPQIMKAMDGHVLGKAVLVGRFHRPM